LAQKTRKKTSVLRFGVIVCPAKILSLFDCYLYFSICNSCHTFLLFKALIFTLKTSFYCLLQTLDM